jgi:hypothetical protein
MVILFDLNKETCDEESAKFICQQCDSIFCEKCFDFSHRSEKKKTHEKKEFKKDFISQKCSKHENKKLDFFCLNEKVKCCSLCLISDHQNHKVEQLSEATKKFKARISEMDFKEIYSDLEKEMKGIDKEITLKQKELLDLQVEKQQKVDLLDSVQKISASIKQEEDVDKIIEWSLYLEEKIGFNEYQLYASGSNVFGELDLRKELKGVNLFTNINQLVEWISCGFRHIFAYYGILNLIKT